MRPEISLHDPADQRRAHGVLQCQGPLDLSVRHALANVAHLIRRQAAIPVALALLGAALASHVGQILGLSAEPEMARVAAAGVVAGMQDDRSGRDLDAGQSKGHAMRVVILAMMGSKLAVADRGEGTDPGPTLVSFSAVDLRPESYIYGLTALPVVPATEGAVEATAAFHGGRIGSKELTAHAALSTIVHSGKVNARAEEG